MFVKIKTNSELTIETMLEQYATQKEMVKDDIYTVLVDATRNSNAGPEVKKMMAEYNPPNRLATAIITNNNFAINIIANFYLKVNRPKNKTKLFNYEEEAIAWLNSILKKHQIMANNY